MLGALPSPKPQKLSLKLQGYIQGLGVKAVKGRRFGSVEQCMVVCCRSNMLVHVAPFWPFLFAGAGGFSHV